MTDEQLHEFKSIGEAIVHIVCAGGLTDEQGKLKGSAVIVDFEDEAGVKEYIVALQ